MLTWIIIIAALTVVDQVTKVLVLKFLEPVGSVDVIDGVLRFTYVENRGAAFGMLSDNRWVFMIISTLAIAALLVYLWKFRPDSRFACMALSLIVAGGIGNMIDRVYLGFVVDFIDFCALGELWVWVFNIADACVCVGGGMLILWLIVSIVKEYKEERKKKQETPTAENSTEKK